MNKYFVKRGNYCSIKKNKSTQQKAKHFFIRVKKQIFHDSAIFNMLNFQRIFLGDRGILYM